MKVKEIVDTTAIRDKVSNLLKQAYDLDDIVSSSQLHNSLTGTLFWTRNVSDINAESELEEIKKQGPRQVCQYQFKKNDIVWICRSCQSDETCVLCNDCFQDSVHQGHEVYFYHSQAGGCCDCGDAGAWKPEGFCTRHGHSHPNPIETVPDDVRIYGKAVIDTVVQKMVDFCEDCALSYDVDNVCGEGEFNVYVHNDDIHTLGEIADALAKEPESIQDALIGTSLLTDGCICVGGPAPLNTMRGLAQSLNKSTLQVSLVPVGRPRRIKAFLACVSWLYKLAHTGDGMGRLVCSAIPIRYIQRIFTTDPYLSRDMVVPLHDLFLTLMADQPFKIASSRGYALALAHVADLYGRGIGVAEHSLFGLSVQFLNRYVYVEGMIHEYGFFSTVSSSLLKMILGAGPNFVDSIILKNRRYNPLLADLKVVFTLPETPRYFSAICMDDILEVFTLVQYLHPQTRATQTHVEYESRDWMYAFNLYLGLGSLFDYMVNWYESPDSMSTATELDAALPTVQDHMQRVLRSVIGWQSEYISNASFRWASVIGMPPSLEPFSLYEEPPSKSFHIVLHRFFATCVREACKYKHLESALLTVQRGLVNEISKRVGPADRALESLTGLIDFPLLDLVLESQIKVDMWRRNGQMMLDQIMNYSEPPFCRIFRDLDLLLIQFCGSVYGVSHLLNHIMTRFGVLDFLTSFNAFMTDRATVNRLVEELISFLIILVTEIPLPGFESAGDRVKIMLRRELVHKLVGGSCPYSDLQACMGLVPESEKVKSSVLDSVIEAIAEWQEGTALEPSKLRLKEAAWAEYDPAFPHASNKTHQIAMETRPKLKYAQPMTPPPPPAHPAFVSLRLSILCDPILLTTTRNLVYAFAAIRLPPSPAFVTVKSQWELQCSTSCFVKVLQLLTLVIHNAFSKEQVPPVDSTSDLNDSVPNADERKALLSAFMLECPCTLGVDSTNHSTLPSMINVLMDLHDSLNSSGGDSHTVLCLLWIIGKVGELSLECDKVVDERMNKQLNEKRAIEMKERRDRARAKAMAAMKKSANAFAEHIEGLSDEEEDEAADSVSPGQEGSAIECIICRSHESNDVMGYLAFSQATRFFQHKEPVMHLEEKSSENPSDKDCDLHIQFCGHCMHIGCFDPYFAMVIDRAGHQNALILDTDRGQFQCPLCKKIGNVLVPCIPADNRLEHSVVSDIKSNEWVEWIEKDLLRHDDVECLIATGSTSICHDAESAMEESEEKEEEQTQHISNKGGNSSSFGDAIVSFFRRITTTGSAQSVPDSPIVNLVEEIVSNSEGVEDWLADDDHAQRLLDSRDEDQTRWFRFMSNLCEPALGTNAIFDRLESYRTIPDYVDKALSAVVSSLFVEILEKGSMYHLQQGSNGVSGINAYKHMGDVISATRRSLDAWGIHDTLRNSVMSALKGDLVESQTPWTQSIHVAVAARNSVSTDYLANIGQLWFSQPVLAMPLAQVVVLLLATNGVEFSVDCDIQTPSDDVRSPFVVRGRQHFEAIASYRWVCMASLTQIILSEVLSYDFSSRAPSTNEDGTRQIGRKRHVEVAPDAYDEIHSAENREDTYVASPNSRVRGWKMWVLFEGIMDRIRQHYPAASRLNDYDVDQLLLTSLRKWMSFISLTLHIITRTQQTLLSVSADTPFPKIPEADVELDESCVMPYALSAGVGDVLASEVSLLVVLRRIGLWMDALKASSTTDQQTKVSLVSNSMPWVRWNSVPAFVTIPEEYTKLHGLLNSQCSMDYPALCMCCGAILNSAGQGECTEHVKKCGGEVGIFFLLQDCSMLLLHRQRGSYYPSPYVDSHGEKHRHFRGRPLFIDKKRLKMLHKLWLTHSIPREVAQKRSSSTRVIINGHY